MARYPRSMVGFKLECAIDVAIRTNTQPTGHRTHCPSRSCCAHPATHRTRSNRKPRACFSVDVSGRRALFYACFRLGLMQGLMAILLHHSHRRAGHRWSRSPIRRNAPATTCQMVLCTIASRNNICTWTRYIHPLHQSVRNKPLTLTNGLRTCNRCRSGYISTT